MGEQLRLRPAVKEDIDLIFEWANDPDERRFSFHPDPILYDTHCKWFASRLESDETYLYVLCNGDVPVGQARFDINGDEAIVSYFVDKAYRGEGYGIVNLRLLENKVEEEFRQLNWLIAYVSKKNIPSQKAMRTLGYSEEPCDKEGWVLFRKKIR